MTVPTDEMLHHLGQLLLCLAAVVAVVVKYRWLARGKSTRPITMVLALLAVSAFSSSMLGPLTSLWTKRQWSTYHYFLGAKYFEQLEYRDLYRFTVLADRDSGTHRLDDLRSIRNLDDYSFESPDQGAATARERLGERFTPERWSEFQQDWAAMSRLGKADGWHRKLNDHGFNPPPVWNVVPGAVAQQVMVEDSTTFLVVRHADLLLFFAALVLCGLLCGIDAPLLIFIFFATAYFNEGHLIATYFGFVHLAALIVAMSLYRARRVGSAGVGFAVATMWRLFPLFFLVGPAVIWLRDALRRRRVPKRKTVLLASWLAACVLFGVVGLSQGRGPSTTKDFVTNIGMHADFIRFDGNKFGLPLAVTDHPASEHSTFESRKQHWDEHPIRHFALGALIVGLALLAMWRGKDQDGWAIPLGVLLLFTFMTVSRYYYLSLAVFLIPGRPLQHSGFAAWSAAGLLMCNGVFQLVAALVPTQRAIFAAGTQAFLLVFLSFPLFLLIAPWWQRRRTSGTGADSPTGNASADGAPDEDTSRASPSGPDPAAC